MRKRPWPNYRYYIDIYTYEPMKIVKTDHDLKQEPPEYEAEVRYTRPRILVKFYLSSALSEQEIRHF
jgi:hypothetical protein